MWKTFLLLVGFFVMGSSVTAQQAFTVPALPAPLIVSWDANPPAQGVLKYTVQLDALPPVETTTLSQVVTVFDAGLHRITVTASNAAGTSQPATLMFTVVIVVVPTPPANVMIRPGP